MTLIAIFMIGLSVGVVAQRYGFCIFGSLVELLTLGSPRRLFGVFAAMAVFSSVHVLGYRHAVEDPGAMFFVGGLIQGIGYYLAVGCPLGLLVRIGEGSKSHMIVFLGFAAGLAVYVGLLHGPVSAALEPFSTSRAETLLDLFR